MTEKCCTACRKMLELEAFAPSAKGTLGRTGQCRKCRNAHAAARRLADPEAARHRDAKSRAARDKARDAATTKARRDRDPSVHRAAQARFRAQPGRAEAAKARTKEWTRGNRLRKNAQNQVRQKRVQLATPPWADRTAILEIYLARPEGFEVDHVIPLVGRTPGGGRVCGLHVPWNLQYLPKLENRRKHANMPEGI